MSWDGDDSNYPPASPSVSVRAPRQSVAARRLRALPAAIAVGVCVAGAVGYMASPPVSSKNFELELELDRDVAAPASSSAPGWTSTSSPEVASLLAGMPEGWDGWMVLADTKNATDTDSADIEVDDDSVAKENKIFIPHLLQNVIKTGISGAVVCMGSAPLISCCAAPRLTPHHPPRRTSTTA